MAETIISTDGKFEWDKEKSLLNEQKHQLSFETAQLAFTDDFFIELQDIEHSFEEARFKGIGSIQGILVVTVFYTDRERIRLISARKANSLERRAYYENILAY